MYTRLWIICLPNILLKMTNKTFKSPNSVLYKFGIVLLLLSVNLISSCSHLFFEEIQPKGGELQNEFPLKIQGDFSNWCYTDSLGKEICIERSELLKLDSLELKNLVNKDTNLRNAFFIQIDTKSINVKSFSTDLDGKYELNRDVFLSKMDNLYVLNLKADSKNFMKKNGNAIETDLFECFVFELDSSSYIHFFRITDNSPLKHKTTLIPTGSGSQSYIAKDDLTRKNIYKAIYSKPLPFILLNLDSKVVNGPFMNEEAGIECEPTKREYKKAVRKQPKLKRKI